MMKWRNHKKMTILLIVFGALAAVWLVMFFTTESESDLPEEYRQAIERQRKKQRELESSREQAEISTRKIENGLLHETFRLKNGWWGKETQVGFLVPLDARGKPRRGSGRMIFYAPFTGEQDRIPGSQKWLHDLARESNCTVFTMKIPARSSDSENRKTYFIYPESGWHEMVFLARKAVAAKLGVPVGKLLITGESSGGSMAQQLCASNPDNIMAAAWIGGSRYAEENGKTGRFPRLVLNTWDCPGEAASIRYAEKLRADGVAALDLRTPPDFRLEKSDHHAPNELVYRLMISYLSGIAALGEKNSGELPPSGEWLDGRFPSPEFAALWCNLQEHSGSNGKGTAIVFADSRNPLGRDIGWLLRKDGWRVLTVPVRDQLLQERERCAEFLAGVWKENSLPVTVWGIGDEALPGIVAAMEAADPRLRKIVLFDVTLDSPFEELSVKAHKAVSAVPVIHYGKTSAEPISGVTCLPLEKRGNREYAAKVAEALRL